MNSFFVPAALLSLLILLSGGCTAPQSSVKPNEKKPAAATASPASQTEATPVIPFPAGHDWVNLIDGKTLKGWAVTDFAGHGEVRVTNGKITLESGVMTGITWTNDIPRMNFEVELDAMRVDGSDFFCALTFPVGANPCSLVVGGWGGGVVGLSSLDGDDAASNETTKYMSFVNGRWYKIRLRVEPKSIQGWIDGEKMVDVVTTGRKISIRSEVELSIPFGIATWSTTGAVRNLRVRRL